MFKNLIYILCITFVAYVILIFISPDLSLQISKTLGLNPYRTAIIELKDRIDNSSTNIPSKNEFISGALDLKNTIIDGVDTTKEKIDSFRGVMSGAEDTYNEIKEGYDKIKGFVDTNSGRIDEMKEVIEDVSKITNTLTNTGNIN